jgi:pilus assembly protein CpaF
MTGLDLSVLKTLQEDLGSRRQTMVEQRRVEALTPLTGEDARQRDKWLVREVVTAAASARVEAGQDPWPWEITQQLIEALEARLFGAGALQQLLEDDQVENIDINGYSTVFVEYADGSVVRHQPVVASNEELVETIQTLAAHVGLSSRAFDVANPRVNLRLPDGSRLYAVQAVSREPVVSIRRHRFPRVFLKDLVAWGSMDEELAEFFSASVRARKNLMIAGATGAGKTTLLRALASVIDPAERLVTVERSLEMGLDEHPDLHPNTIAFEERLPNAEGVGGESMAQLVRDSLRMNPSRVIVGEVLGDEVVTMLNAMTQGNDGSLSTIHANSSGDVADRLATYAIQAPERLSWQATVRLTATALDFIVFMRRVRTVDGQQRLIESVREVVGVGEDTQLLTNEIFAPSGTGMAVRKPSVQPNCLEDLVAAGWQPEFPSGWSR